MLPTPSPCQFTGVRFAGGLVAVQQDGAQCDRCAVNRSGWKIRTVRWTIAGRRVHQFGGESRFFGKVEGEYQGACFPFAKGFPAAVVRLAFAPDHSLFVG